VNYVTKLSNILYHWQLLMTSFCFCETCLLHIKLFVVIKSAIFPFLGGWNFLKGGTEPLENEFNEILGLKREDRFSDHFSDLVPNICSVCFSYLLRLSIFCKASRDMRKFPQKCQKIAGC